ncbi:MAG: hypothetical protein ACRBBO_02000 [Cognatishimia sp.]
MTRLVTLFEDGTALVDSIEADAIGDHRPLPFLSETTRLNVTKAALTEDHWEQAKLASARPFVTAADGDQIQVVFVGPPDWKQLGDQMWNVETGAPHAVFQTSTLLVDDVAIIGCVGLPFEDEEQRRDCAIWCLENGLEDLAKRVSQTPFGGPGPHCTWPHAQLTLIQSSPESFRQSEQPDTKATVTEELCDVPQKPDDCNSDLYGKVFDPFDF